MNLIKISQVAKVTILICPFIFGCVGPTTPFGAINNYKGDGADGDRGVAQERVAYDSEVNFYPQKQVLHDKTDFTIEVKDGNFIPYDYQVNIFHNSYDVTDNFLKQSQVFRSRDGRQLLFTVKDFRLKTLDQNKIKVVFKKNSNTSLEASYELPQCSLFEKYKLKNLGKFNAPKDYQRLIEKVAMTADYNPSFLAGIVAQESGFNPKAVSWAKALGLTQMTPLAEEEVIGQFSDWPRHPGINTLTYLTLKSKIYMGEIDNKTEWRLDPEKSLSGGVAYIRYLSKYWGRKKNRELIESLPGDVGINTSEIILASYNSGAARVKSAIIEKNKRWKHHGSLKEAVKYLKKVSSYCFHYSESEVLDDHET